MKVTCIKGHEGLLDEGYIYTVIGTTSQGNYILAEVEVPEGYTSFSADRFGTLLNVEDWTEEMEEAYWSEQPNFDWP